MVCLLLGSLSMQAQCAIELQNEGIFADPKSGQIVNFSVNGLEITFQDPNLVTDTSQIEIIQLLNLNGQNCAFLTIEHNYKELTLIVWPNNLNKIGIYAGEEQDEHGDPIIMIQEFKRI